MDNRLVDLIKAVEVADSADLLLEAVEDLAEACQPEAISTLIEVLSYNNPGAAVAAVDGLVELGIIAVPALMEQLDGHNYTARAWAIRALAGIGDPRGLVILLGAATTDFALSVRRAAARGLGTIRWQGFPEPLLQMSQQEVLITLLCVADKDQEWVVRYAAVVSLQALAHEFVEMGGRSQILQQLERMAIEDESDAVRARVWMAQQQLQSPDILAAAEGLPSNKDQPSPLLDKDWQRIFEQLQAHQSQDLINPDSIQASK